MTFIKPFRIKYVTTSTGYKKEYYFFNKHILTIAHIKTFVGYWKEYYLGGRYLIYGKTVEIYQR